MWFKSQLLRSRNGGEALKKRKEGVCFRQTRQRQNVSVSIQENTPTLGEEPVHKGENAEKIHQGEFSEPPPRVEGGIGYTRGALRREKRNQITLK